jgi:Acyl-CoA dehydrogenase, N-terminal domain
LPKSLLQITDVIPFPPPRLSPLSPTALIEPMRQIYGVSDKVLAHAIPGGAHRQARRVLAPRAAHYDRKAIFLIENFHYMHAEGLLAICIPREEGGLGTDFAIYCDRTGAQYVRSPSPKAAQRQPESSPSAPRRGPVQAAFW